METRVVQISTVIPKKGHTKPVRAGNGRLKTTEPATRGRVQDTEDASQVLSPSAGQSRREKLLVQTLKSGQSPKSNNPVWVPVISSTGSPLMPCRPAYARALIKSGRAKRRWYKGIFAIKMLDRAEGKVQQVVCGIDPGSKREAFTVQSKQHTYLNVLSDAITWVSDRVKTRRDMRRARRTRKVPCRKKKSNRNTYCKGWLAPSVQSRWQIKFRIVLFLNKLYPISDYIVEDNTAKNKNGKKKWNKNFSPIKIGKTRFYTQLSKIGNLILKRGYDTFIKRNNLELKKSESKLSETFDAHNVDSWVLSSFVTKKTKIDNKSLFRILPLKLHRRYLHKLEPSIRGLRRSDGGTMSLGLKRGSIIKHYELGIVYIGGTKRNKISLHSIKTGARLTQSIPKKEITFLSYNNWRSYFIKG